jgi:hypothetical protein
VGTQRKLFFQMHARGMSMPPLVRVRASARRPSFTCTLITFGLIPVYRRCPPRDLS